jgi:hypothetical protein
MSHKFRVGQQVELVRKAAEAFPPSGPYEIATYKLSNISRVKLENLIHLIFDPARLDIEIKDRFGNPITPREWFLVPVFVIDEAVERIKDGTITGYRYDPKKAALVRVGEM